MSTTGPLNFLARRGADDSTSRAFTEYFELAWMTKRTPALDPCKHALDDRYYQPEVDALIKWLWPVPRPRSQGWDKLEVLLQGRVEAVVRRRAVSCVDNHVTSMAVSNIHLSNLLCYKHGSELYLSRRIKENVRSGATQSQSILAGSYYPILIWAPGSWRDSTMRIS